MKVILFSKYDDKGASSRVRCYQYLPYLKDNGINVDVKPLFSNYYLSCLYEQNVNKKHIIIWAYLNRFFHLIKLLIKKNYDLIWIEKELFPWLPYIVESYIYKHLHIPTFIDYDDPIFDSYERHRKGFVRYLLGTKISCIMRDSSYVSVSSEYMYRYACLSGAKDISLIPPAVEEERFSKCKKHQNSQCVIGWIGSPSTTKYLSIIEGALNNVHNKYKVEFILIGAGGNFPESIPFKVIDWDLDSEACLLVNFDIGIMPLFDDEWSKSKDHYKLVNYMASSTPYIASSVEGTEKVTKNNINGFIAHSHSEWVSYLSFLIENPTERVRMGNNGYNIFKDEYSTSIVSTKLVNLIHKVLD
jgi:glycosyltransferase involved in cell wall biosynthesis